MKKTPDPFTDRLSMCRNCGGSMIEGFMVQKLDGLTLPIGTWIEGQPERTLLGSTKTPADKIRTITTRGCSTCGLLEFHARKQEQEMP